jgi:hypothetical protein
MAATLTGLTATLTPTLVGTAVKAADLQSGDGAEFAFLAGLAKSFTYGTGDNQVDAYFGDSHGMAADANKQYDLVGGESDPFGDTVSFSKIKAMVLRNTSDELGTPTAAILAVGGGTDGAGTAAWVNWVANASDIVNVPAGGMLIITAPEDGFAIAGGADVLRVEEVASLQCQFEIAFLGLSA